MRGKIMSNDFFVGVLVAIVACYIAVYFIIF